MNQWPKTRALWRTVDYLVVGFTNLLDRAKAGRNAALYVALCITWQSWEWTARYADAAMAHPTLESAAVIAAVLGCSAKLQQYVLAEYVRSTNSPVSDAPLSPIATQINPTAVPSAPMRRCWPAIPPSET